MKHHMLSFLFFLFCFSTLAQNRKDLNIDYMLRGRIYAGSSIEDTLAAGGFGNSDNLPKPINEDFKFSETGIFLIIDTAKIISIANKYNGYDLIIGNRSDTVLRLKASDSRLYVVAEAYYNNEWKPIEYLPSSWCGNSYHHIYLKPGQCWTFPVPKFAGKIKGKIRYRLLLESGKYIYSNEFLANFNKGQFINKPAYKPNGLMDPYND